MTLLEPSAPTIPAGRAASPAFDRPLNALAARVANERRRLEAGLRGDERPGSRRPLRRRARGVPFRLS